MKINTDKLMKRLSDLGRRIVIVLLPLLLGAGLLAEEPPKTWLDPDTGHRIWRITNEPGSDSFYFNFNAFTPDGKEMVYTTTDGSLMVLKVGTWEARPLANEIARAIAVGRKTPTIYFSKREDDYHQSLWSANIDTAEVRKIADLPRRASVTTINADETLGAGAFIEGDATAPGAYGGAAFRTQPSRMGPRNLGEPIDKGKSMDQRLEAKLPNTLFTINLQTGAITKLIEHSTDWLNHLQFSPTDPTLLMYCHEGGWQLVDRIWTIKTDGSQNQLIHKRIMEEECAGHEWWSANGKNIWYQLHFPIRVPNSTFIASYDVSNGARVWYHQFSDSDSIHHNSSPDGKLFCGDGNKSNPWIVLCRPVLNQDNHTVGENLIKSGKLDAEHLVNLSKTAIHEAHNYRLEPNPMFTPDQKYIIFRSNIFGEDYAFAVETEKVIPP